MRHLGYSIPASYMFNVKIQLDLCIYSLRKLREVFKKILLGLNIDSIFCTVYPACDAIRILLVIKQEGKWLLSFDISGEKHVTKNLSTDITISQHFVISNASFIEKAEGRKMFSHEI